MVIAYHRDMNGNITKAYEVTGVDEEVIKKHVNDYNTCSTTDQISIAGVPERSLMKFLFEKYRSRVSDDIALLRDLEDRLNEALESVGDLIDRAKYEVR